MQPKTDRLLGALPLQVDLLIATASSGLGISDVTLQRHMFLPSELLTPEKLDWPPLGVARSKMADGRIDLIALGPLAVFVAADLPTPNGAALRKVRRPYWRASLPPHLLVSADHNPLRLLTAIGECFLHTICSPGMIGFDLTDFRHVLPDGASGICAWIAAEEGQDPSLFASALISQVVACGFLPEKARSALLCIETCGDYALQAVNDLIISINVHLGEADFAWVDAAASSGGWKALLLLNFSGKAEVKRPLFSANQAGFARRIRLRSSYGLAGHANLSVH